MIEEISILDTPYIIPFKAKAWIDLSIKKEQGISVDSKNIRKHRNDIFRLSVILREDQKIFVTSEIYNDMATFIKRMENEEINLEDLGLENLDKKRCTKSFKKSVSHLLTT